MSDEFLKGIMSREPQMWDQAEMSQKDHSDEIAALRAEVERLERESEVVAAHAIEQQKAREAAEAQAAACVAALEYYGNVYHHTGMGVGDGRYDPVFVREDQGEEARKVLATLPARAKAMAEVVKFAVDWFYKQETADEFDAESALLDSVRKRLELDGDPEALAALNEVKK